MMTQTLMVTYLAPTQWCCLAQKASSEANVEFSDKAPLES
ncbi:hypothetical protein VCR1J2_200491 [Vibrio coralliirubri]|nr:hypothetical protein VCR1J2_200491 [Vibrio coralliirubri]